MNFDITKVSIDGAVDDLSEEQLRELVSKFEDAQESNVAEFERAAEEMPDIEESKIEDFEDARRALIEEIVEADTFDEVPLGEGALVDCTFSELQEWSDFVTENISGSADEADETDDGGFNDFGQKAPTGDDETTDFADKELENVPGLKL